MDISSVKELLYGTWPGINSWVVRKISSSSFLVVSLSPDDSVEAAGVGFVVAEGVLRLQGRTLEKGTYPNPRHRLSLSLLGLPLILCDDEGITFLVKYFVVVEMGFPNFALVGEIMALKVVIRIRSIVDILSVISLIVVGETFVVRVVIDQILQPWRQGFLGQPFSRREKDDGKVGPRGKPRQGGSNFESPSSRHVGPNSPIGSRGEAQFRLDDKVRTELEAHLSGEIGSARHEHLDPRLTWICFGVSYRVART